MIKCNRCGTMNPGGAVCQSCGSPLVSSADDGFSPRMGTQDQSELPAWLESLRAGERPAAPANSPSNFSTADLIEEGSLPSWMSSGRENSISNSMPPFPSSVDQMAVPNPPIQEFTAQSLIDETSLPSWMTENKQQQQQQSQSNIPMSDLPASSLVQQDNIPEWMKSLQQPSARTNPSADPAPSFSDPFAQKPASSFSENRAAAPGEVARPDSTPAQPAAGFSAHDLIDQQSLPSWMNAQGSKQASSPSTPSQAPNVGMPSAPTQASQTAASGFSARDLVDQQSLPSWMNAQGNKPEVSPAASVQGQNAGMPSAPTQAPQTAASGFSAHDLIDQQSLPSWMNAQGSKQASSPSTPSQAPNAGMPSSPAQTSQASASGFSARDLVDQQSLPSWMNAQGNKPAALDPSQGQGMPSSPTSQASAQQGFSASSLVDASALPQWMREGGQNVNSGSAANMGGMGAQNPSWSAGMPPMPQTPSQSARSMANNAAQPFAQSPLGNNAPQSNENVAASSFIDQSALPEWLRTADKQAQQGSLQPNQSFPGTPMVSQAGSYATPHHADNIRVPNRPRNEVNTTDTNEIAANVFASMLGVASSTPNYATPQSQPQTQQGNPATQSGPGRQGQGSMPDPFAGLGGQANQSQPLSRSGVYNNQIGQSSYGQMASSNGGQMSYSGMGNQAGQYGMPMNQMGQPGSSGMGQMNQGSLAGMDQMGQMPGGMGNIPVPGAVPGTPANMSGGLPQGNASMNQSMSGIYGNNYQSNASMNSSSPLMNSNIGGMQQPGNSPMSGAPASAYQNSEAAGDQKNSKKRGLFGAFLDWLSR